jgi:hypothetical protein
MSRAWFVPIEMLLSLIFFAFSIAFVILLSATTLPPLQAMLMPPADLDSVRGDGDFEVPDWMIGKRTGGGFAMGLGCTPLGHNLVPYLFLLRTFCIHLRCACLAFAGINEQAIWLALCLQSVKQQAQVCQRMHMMVLLTLALSVRHFPANWDHNLSSFSLKSAHCWVLWITFLADFLFLFSLSSSSFHFFNSAPNFPPPLSSLSDEVSTTLKDNGRITLNRLVMISLWSVEKSIREQSTSSRSSAQVQFSKYSWKRVHTIQSTFVGKRLSSSAHPL